MYIALCDDQAEELEFLIGLIGRWQSERQRAVRFKAFTARRIWCTPPKRNRSPFISWT